MPDTFWKPLGIALSGVCLSIILVPILVLLLAASPSTLLDTLGETEVLDALVLTLSCAAIATFLGLAFGTPLAYLLARSEFPGRQLVQGVVDLPLVIPHPVAGLALLLILAVVPREYSPVGHWVGIVLAMFLVSVPLLLSSLQEGFKAVPTHLEWASRSLGAGPAKTFLRITLPLCRKHVVAGCIMMWARSVSEFGAIAILVYHPKVISVLIYDRFTSYGLTSALPVAAVLLWLSVAILVVMRWTQQRAFRVAEH